LDSGKEYAMSYSIEQHFAVTYSFPIWFTRGAFDPENRILARVLESAGVRRHRVLAVLDQDVLSANPDLLAAINAYGDRHRQLLEFVAAPFLVRGGEVCKSDPLEVAKIHSLVERYCLCRQSFVLVIGGGAVLDAAGYAAATAHRGVRLIRMPTTVLAQNDAGVGVKNGVNAFGRKNFVGTFAPPFAIVNDFDFLESLPERDKRAGIAEAIKVALIKDRAFFDELYRERSRLATFEPAAMERMIVRCAELHCSHISGSGDPFEFGSARPLDFGHWSAHKLEELTEGSLKHGEAVAIGVALDSVYSRYLGRLTDLELERILRAMEAIGFELYHGALRWMDCEKALRDFREHLGGDLHITLLDGIGQKLEVHEVDAELVRRCIDDLARRHLQRKAARGPAADDAARLRGHPAEEGEGRMEGRGRKTD
jgi:3-dehydroquinate synthase